MLTEQHLPILRRARAVLISGRQRFLCLCVEVLQFRLDALHEEVVDHIQASIAPHYTLEMWLGAQLYPGAEDPDIALNILFRTPCDLMPLARLAWLDKLIHDLEQP
jgi:hypothetical protein